MQITSVKLDETQLPSKQTHELWSYLEQCSSLQHLELHECDLRQENLLPAISARTLDASWLSEHTDYTGIIASTPNLQELRVTSGFDGASPDSLMSTVSNGVVQTSGRLRVLHVSYLTERPISPDVVSQFVESALPHMKSLEKLELLVDLETSDAIRIISTCRRMPHTRKMMYGSDFHV